MTAEQMRQRVLDLIRGWATNSTISNNEQCQMLLNALAGDVQVIETGEPEDTNV